MPKPELVVLESKGSDAIGAAEMQQEKRSPEGSEALAGNSLGVTRLGLCLGDEAYGDCGDPVGEQVGCPDERAKQRASVALPERREEDKEGLQHEAQDDAAAEIPRLPQLLNLIGNRKLGHVFDN